MQCVVAKLKKGEGCSGWVSVVMQGHQGEAGQGQGWVELKLKKKMIGTQKKWDSFRKNYNCFILYFLDMCFRIPKTVKSQFY